MATSKTSIKRKCSVMEASVIDRHEIIVNSGSGWNLDYISAMNLEVGILHQLFGWCASEFTLSLVPRPVYELTR